MTTDFSKLGPGFEGSQQIGLDAERTLNANCPVLWTLGSSTAQDFGFDYHIMVADSAGAGIKNHFFLQLKGTTQPKVRLADGMSLSHPFARQTLNLWHSNLSPVFVAVVDLIDERDPRRATVHYRFLSPDLDEILFRADPTQETITVRIPRAQLVHRDLDIAPDIQAYIDEWRDAMRISREERRASGEVEPAMPLAAGSVPSTGGITDEAALGTNALEKAIEASSIASELKAALGLIQQGSYERALSTIGNIGEEELAAPTLETGLRCYLKAKAFQLWRSDPTVDKLLEVAATAVPANDEITAALAQRRLDSIPLGSSGTTERAELALALSPPIGYSTAVVAAKVLAANGEIHRARELLSPFPKNRIAITEMVISVVAGDWKRVLAEAKATYKLSELTPPQELTAKVLEARAYFQLAMGPLQWPDEGDLTIPATGTRTMDIGLMEQCYQCAEMAMIMAQAQRWPAISLHLLDTFTVSAMVLRKIETALPLLSDFGLARSDDQQVREAVGRFALNADRPELLVRMSEAAGKKEQYANEAAFLTIAACRMGSLSKAFAYITDQILEQKADSDVYLSALMTVGVAADSAARSDLVEKIAKRLGETQEGRHFGAMMSSAIQVRRSVLSKGEAIKQLHGYWLDNGRTLEVGRHILINADGADKGDAKIICEVGDHSESIASLDPECWYSYGQSLITLGRYDEAITKMQSASSRFAAEPKLITLLGVALELKGDAAEAFKIFERLVESGDAPETARRYYINSAARIGFIGKAESQVREALAKATKRSAKLRHLNTLFQLVSLSPDLKPSELWSLAWEYGRLASPSDEREEGIFLQECMFATASGASAVSGAELEEFARRRDEYVRAFPDSDYVRMVTTTGATGSEHMLGAIKQVIGVSDDDLRRSAAIERGLNSGRLAVPFSWRPRRYLRGVPDVLSLWEMRRRQPLEMRAWHFSSYADDYNRRTPADLSQVEPVVSFTSLLVLDDLGLLDVMLQSFERVVVARATLFALQNATSPLIGLLGREKAARILSRLRINFSKIAHPPYPESGNSGPVGWHNEEVLAMSISGRVYFCDDVNEAAAVCGGLEDGRPAAPSLSAVEFLAWLDRRELMSPAEIAGHISELVKLKIGIVIQLRYFIAAIPDSLQRAASMESVGEDSADTLATMLDASWAIDKPFQEIVVHFSSLMSYLISRGNASDTVLHYLWLRWIGAVRFNAEIGEPILEKMAYALIVMITQVPEETLVISRLWHSFWRAIGLSGAAIEQDVDRSGIVNVARLLGRARAGNDEIDRISIKAKLGLTDGTQLYELFNETFVAAVAQEVMATKKR